MHRCPNRACPSRGLETLINWTGVADIEGVGEQTIRILWDKGLVRSLPDLYRLTKEQLLEVEGFGEISATAAIDQIERSEGTPFSRVLLGLNIPGIGWVLAQNLARHFENVDRVIAASRRKSPTSRASGPTAPRRSSSGSTTTRTARSSRSCATWACGSRSVRASVRPRGR